MPASRVDTFRSSVRKLGTVIIPPATDLRVLMMPFHIADPRGSLPESVGLWRNTIADMIAMTAHRDGTAYLTIDEQWIPKGRTHRRPGFHVDGLGPEGAAGSWGGGWSGDSQDVDDNPKELHRLPYVGMLLAASAIGCRAWTQEFHGWPLPNGDCNHLADQCRADAETIMQAGGMYGLSGLTVHEAIPMAERTHRQFIRISMPSAAPWNDSNTPNPLGIQPEGPIIGPRPARFMRGEN